MLWQSVFLPGLTLLALWSSSLQAQSAPPQQGQTALRFHALRNWKIQLPAEKWTPVGAAFDFKGSLGRSFSVTLAGTRLLVDSDGDGKGDAKVEGKKAFLTLAGLHGAYALRLKNEGGWRYAPGGALKGRIQGVKIQLFDQNNNGSFADVGQDAMIVGRGRVASYLSEVVNIKGRLYTIQVSKMGTHLDFAPYQGPSGMLDLTRCSTRAKVLGTVVKSRNGRFSFEMARSKQGLRVPAGSYRLEWGEMGLKNNRVHVSPGRMDPLVVKPGATTSLVWGGPLKADFSFARKGKQLTLAPTDIRYFGVAGERYSGWMPAGSSPKIVVTNRKTGREIVQAYFAGSS